MPADEAGFKKFALEHKISGLPVMETAIDSFALALANLNKTVSADRIVLSGPFVKVPEILERLSEVFFLAPAPLCPRQMPNVLHKTFLSA